MHIGQFMPCVHACATNCGLRNAVRGVQAAVLVVQQLYLLARAIFGLFYSSWWLGAGLWDDTADEAGSGSGARRVRRAGGERGVDGWQGRDVGAEGEGAGGGGAYECSAREWEIAFKFKVHRPCVCVHVCHSVAAFLTQSFLLHKLFRSLAARTRASTPPPRASALRPPVRGFESGPDCMSSRGHWRRQVPVTLAQPSNFTTAPQARVEHPRCVLDDRVSLYCIAGGTRGARDGLGFSIGAGRHTCFRPR